MIFTTKRKPEAEEKNWCVVLKSFNSTLDRTRLIQKLQKAFEISAEDALDVMQNTPIILLDHLPQEQASKIKEYFSESGVEVMLTQDSFYKRRCYRTVWPTMPNLESILKPIAAVSASSRVTSAVASVRENVDQPMSENTLPPSAPELSSVRPSQDQAWSTSQKEFLEQKEMLIRDSLKLQEEVARLRSTMDRSLEQVAEKERALQVLTAEKKEKELEAQRLDSQLAAAEEKFKIAREEFRDTRAYFEERLLAQESKIQDLQAQTEGMNRLLRDVQLSKQELEQVLIDEREKFEVARTQIASGEIDWEKRTAHLRHEAELQKRVLQEYESKLAYFELSRKQIEESELNIRKEMEKQSFAAKNQELRAQHLEKELERFKSSLESQEKTWVSRLQEVEVREKELESARRQIKDLQNQMDHRELIQRKVFIAEQISAKELRLKSLVKKQEQLEVEARGRETDLKKLLEEQEMVEKGLIEDKQAQKHLLDKLKTAVSAVDHADAMIRQEKTPVSPDHKAYS